MNSTDRMYLQYGIDSVGDKLLHAWQQQVLDSNPTARPVPQHQFHLTLLHIGILSEVYREMQAWQPQLTWAVFEREISVFLRATKQILPQTSHVEPINISYMGERAQTAVVSVKAPAELIDAHAKSLHLLQDFFKACGLFHVRAFMHGSPNFKYALVFRPHITLARMAPNHPDKLESSIERCKYIQLTLIKVVHSLR